MFQIAQFINSTDKKELWETIDSSVKQKIIKEMFKSHDDHTKLAKELLKFIRQDEILEKRNIHVGFANLLCILLARSHNSEFIKDIIKTKRCCDLFFYIDSNLLFEFNPNQNRLSCVKDTIEYVNSFSNSEINKEWFKIYKDWVNYYGNIYDETVVIKYWNKYKDSNYCEL